VLKGTSQASSYSPVEERDTILRGYRVEHMGGASSRGSAELLREPANELGCLRLSDLHVLAVVVPEAVAVKIVRGLPPQIAGERLIDYPLAILAAAKYAARIASGSSALIDRPDPDAECIHVDEAAALDMETTTTLKHHEQRLEQQGWCLGKINLRVQQRRKV